VVVVWGLQLCPTVQLLVLRLLSIPEAAEVQTVRVMECD
jgi:hypothetical protein